MARDIEKLEPIREDLFYKVFCTGKETYRIGAYLDMTKPFHGENVHFVDKAFETREEALTRLEEYMIGLSRYLEGFKVVPFGSSFKIEALTTLSCRSVVILPCIFPAEEEAVKTIQGIKYYYENETRCQYYGNKFFSS